MHSAESFGLPTANQLMKSVDARYETASGERSVKIRKNYVALLLIIAVLAGMVIAFLFLR
jgi:hypothetical protein